MQPFDVVVPNTQQSTLTVASNTADGNKGKLLQKKKGRPKKSAALSTKSTSGAMPKVQQILYCVPECRYDRKETTSSEMVRCGLYIVWLHHACVGSSQEEIDLQGAWTCQRCHRVHIV